MTTSEKRSRRPRAFREKPRWGEALAIEPQALDIDFSWGGTQPNDHTEDGLAIVTISGPLEHHAGWWWDSYESILERVEDAMTGQDIVKDAERRARWASWGDLPDDYEPPAVGPARAVILRIDSPGGEAAGTMETHKALRRMSKRHGVPLFAYANEMACSAAYAIASAAQEIWLPTTGMVGSIGVIATLFDRMAQNEKIGLNVELVTSGAYKADGHADRPITDGIRKRMQARVDTLADAFFAIVASSRGTSVNAVASLEAAVFIGRDAVRVGVADGVASWPKFLRTISNTLDSAQAMAPAAA